MTPLSSTKIEGLLLGTAVADSIGLPMEGMTPAKIKKLGWVKNLKHRFFFGRGMWSDDTEQSIMLTQALIASGGDVKKFTRSFAWELRWWILGMPAATGLATAKAIIKLWLGFPPRHSGVFSAGNGSAMRTAPIAAAFPDDEEKRKLFTKAQTRITHSDPKAAIATFAVTELTALFLRSNSAPPSEKIFSCLYSISNDEEWTSLIDRVAEAHSTKKSLPDFLRTINARPEKGVSGYVYQTLPAVIHCGLQHQWDFKKTISAIILPVGMPTPLQPSRGLSVGRSEESQPSQSHGLRASENGPRQSTISVILLLLFKTKAPVEFAEDFRPCSFSETSPF